MTEPPSDDAFLLILFVVLLLCTCGALNVYAVLHAWYARWRLKDGEVLPPRFSSIGAWGLVLFVGIPLPGTGAWTGSLIACLLNIRLKKAVPAIFLGLLLATTIMCVITYGIPALVSSFS